MTPRRKTLKQLPLSALIGWDWGKYLTGLVLIPWIFVWAIYVIASIFTFYILNSSDPAIFNEAARRFFTSPPDLFEAWYIVGLFSLFNYTLAFIFRRTYYRLQSVLIATTFFLQLLFLLITIPYFQVLFAISS
jgi:hypothetical protein